MVKNNLEMAGKVSFIIGLLLAIVAGIIPVIAGYAYLSLMLVILGLIVGFLNISEKNILTMLVAIVALIAVGNVTLNAIPGINTYLTSILQNFLAFVGAAGFVVAVKAIVTVSKK